MSALSVAGRTDMEHHLPFKKTFKKEEKLECGHLWSQTTSTKIPSKLFTDFNKNRISPSGLRGVVYYTAMYYTRKNMVYVIMGYKYILCLITQQRKGLLIWTICSRTKLESM